MLKSLLLIVSLAMSSAGAHQPMAPQCPLDGKSWDVLVQEFVADWQTGRAGFCEFKRFIALRTMISSDMRLDADQYEKRIASLEAFDDQSEPVNYLLASFQETWFNVFFDSIMDREYERSKWYWGAAFFSGGAVAAACLSVPMMRSYSSKTAGIFRGFFANIFGKRVVAYGLSSIGKGSSKVRVVSDSGQKTVEFARPPLMRRQASEADHRTKDIYVSDFWKQMRVIGKGTGAGWIAGAAVSLAVKWVAPKWTTFTARAWAQGRIASFLSPGFLAGLPVTIWATGKVSAQEAKKEFLESVDKSEKSLVEVARSVNAAVGDGDEYQIWLRGEQLKNALMLQNYMLTGGMTQGLLDESERAVKRVLAKFQDCERNRSEILHSERDVFRDRVTKLISSEKLNLKAAIEITDSVQRTLLDRGHPMTEPLIDSGLNFLKRDRWLMDAKELTEDFWDDVEAAVRSSQFDCGLMEQVSHP